MRKEREPCPCCGHRTLRERGGFEVCPVCFWEDDGQDDVDAHVDRGGPNGGSTLWQARTRFLKYGASTGSGPHVRRASADEPKVRHWSLLDSEAVELVPSSDVSPWNLLHDGTIVAIVPHDDRFTVSVEIPYLRNRFEPPGAALLLELCGGSDFEYAEYEGKSFSALSEIVGAEPDILEARREEDRVVVSGSAGVLRLRYRGLALRLDSGSPLALAALQRCARLYWEEWEASAPR